MEEHKGFKIVCQNCGCDKCTVVADIEEDFDYDWEENIISNGFINNGLLFTCPECDQGYSECEDY